MTGSPFVAVALLPVWILLVGALYGVVGAIAARRFGREALLALWPAAVMVLTIVGVIRVRAQQSAIGMPPERQAGWPFAALAFGTATLMFGATTWVLLRQIRRTPPIAPSAGTAARTALACLAGFVAALVLIAILDIAGVPFRVM